MTCCRKVTLVLSLTFTLRHSTFWEILWSWGCRWFHERLPCNYCSFRDHPSRISITKPCGFSGERGRKGGGVRDCLLHRVQMPGYYFLIEPPGVPAYPGIFHLSLDCLPPPPTCHGAAARQKPKLALGTKDRVDWWPDPHDCPRSPIALGPQMSRRGRPAPQAGCRT